MPKIYISHSTHFNYIDELYEPLKGLDGLDFFFPHDENNKGKFSRETIKECDALIAEVSIPSHGVGIELGWALGIATK